MQNLADNLWKLAYDAFEQNVAAGVQTGLASYGAANQKQGTMLNLIAELKRVLPGQEEKAQELIDQIRGEIMVAEAGGWLPPDTARSMQGMLDTAEI